MVLRILFTLLLLVCGVLGPLGTCSHLPETTSVSAAAYAAEQCSSSNKNTIGDYYVDEETDEDATIDSCEETFDDNNDDDDDTVESDGASSSEVGAGEHHHSQHDHILHHDHEPKSVHEFRKAFRHLGTSWKQVFGMYIETFKSAEGKSHKGDVYANGMDKALVVLQGLVEQARIAAEADANNNDNDDDDDNNNANIWDFRTSPYKEFNRTLDDVFLSFLQWAAVQDGKDVNGKERGGVNNSNKNKINVSKAFRRLQSYAQWMEDTGDILVDPSLSASSIRDVWKILNFYTSHDDLGRIVWWLDLGTIDFDEVHKLPPEELLRVFVWFTHVLLFDDGAQNNGMVIVDNMSKIRFWKFMHMMPLEVGLKTDHLLISILPIKTKKALLVNAPLWFEMAFRMLCVFVSKRVKKRVNLIHGKKHKTVVVDTVGLQCIPVGTEGFEGTLDKDMITEQYLQ